MQKTIRNAKRNAVASLSLRTETLRPLTNDVLSGVAGGFGGGPGAPPSPTCIRQLLKG